MSPHRQLSSLFIKVLAFTLAISISYCSAQSIYVRTNLVSDIAGVANFTDPHLVNAWGIVAADGNGPFWIADNGTGFSTLYNGNGVAFPSASPLVVTIPIPPHSRAGAVAAPTGIVFNGTSDFVVSAGGKSGPALFIFATEDGTISGWNPTVNLTHAILVVNNSGPGNSADRTKLGAVYKGLAIGNNGSANLIYATNFRDGVVEIYNAKFQLVKTFTDANVPGGFAPFGIRNINNQLFVTYAKQNEKKHDDVAGPGNGFVDIFDLNGNLISRFASQGTLNSPWGLVLTPASFDTFSSSILVGNFGDGRINAFAMNGTFLGQLQEEHANIIQPLTIDGLWGLSFGNGGTAGPTTTLFFTAGIGAEGHGLFGSIIPQM
jgi:uncharacterized protein (TIGR03118 family)